MITIWIVMCISLLIFLISKQYEEENKCIISGMFFYLALFIMIIFSGMRSSIGDTGYYMYSFNNLPDFYNIFEKKDWGFILIQYVIKLIFSNPQMLLLIIAMITNSYVLITLKRDSSTFLFSIFLFFSAGYYVSSMNGIRQFLVASVLFYYSKHIYEDDKYKFFIIVLLVSTIHASALIMIPIYYIVRKKAWSPTTIILIILSLLLFITFSKFNTLMGNLIQTTQYGNYTESISTDSNNGANILRAVVALIPAILSFVYRKKLRNKIKHYDIYTNFSVLNFIVMLFSSYNWIFARIAMYLNLYNLILLPAIFYFCFDKKMRMLVQYFTICLYLVYFYFNNIPYTYASFYLNINRDLIGPLTRTFYK